MNSLLKKMVWPLMAAPAIYLAIAWKSLPEKVAMHFNLKGEADRFGSRNELITTIIIMTVVNMIVYLLLTNIWRIDPKKNAAENRNRIATIGFATVVLLSAVMCMIIYSASRGNINFSVGLIFSGVGLFFAILGNYLPNMKPNYFAGFRLPWTLENEENWRKTHQLAGRLWFSGGLILAVICLFLPAEVAIIVFFTIMVTITLIPCVYSYRLYRQQKNIHS
ncbi:MAG: SdpI family protein [Chitinophagaceae bacterium]|nr:SdpI family protein [Chitinophagaceae bacterium]